MYNHILEKPFINFMDQNNIEQAIDYLDKYPSLIKMPSQKTASYISALLIICNELNECIKFSEHQIKINPSSDLHYNLAYAYELNGNVLEAIKNYQCARLFSLDLEFRNEIQVKILKFKYPNVDTPTFDSIVEYTQSVKKFIKAQLTQPTENLNPKDFVNQKPPLIESQISILYGTIEIANHISHYVKYFRNNNFNVLGINYAPSYLNYECDFSQNLATLSPNEISTHYLLNAVDLINDYDVFHFLFNQTLIPNHIDLIVLKKLRKKVFMHNLGSEIRIPDIARKMNPYWKYAENYLSNLNGPQIQNTLQFLSSWIDNSIVNDYEMRSYTEKYYKNIYMIGLPIDIDKYSFQPLKESKIIHIVHAPTNSNVKGTAIFECAIKELSEKYPIRYTRVERMAHSEAIAQYKIADIIFDQLIIGTHGSFTIECLAMGKCVATFINEDLPTPHGEDIPIWNVNVNNIVQRLEELISSFDLRSDLSQRARKYAEKNNDYNIICKLLLDIYLK